MTPNLNRWAAGILIDEIEDYKDCILFDVEELCDYYNGSNSVTFNRKEAKEWTIANWEELGELFDDMQEAGIDISDFNIFYDCEKLQVMILVWITNALVRKYFAKYVGKKLLANDIADIQNFLEMCQR